MFQHANDIFLSAVLDRPVISLSGREVGRLSDVAMSPGDPLPVAHHVLVKTKTGILRVAFGELAMFNQFAVSLKGEPEVLPDLAEPENEVLMRRDILDKQIVDVDGAKVVRVNDLKLALGDGNLCLAAVDVGFRGILRRLGYLRAWDWLGGAFHRRLASREIDWLLVQPLDRKSVV
jgi:sporulation protein YlmC with PRC-barrel domain